MPRSRAAARFATPSRNLVQLRAAGSASRLNRHALQDRGDVGREIGGIGSGRQIAFGDGALETLA
jgi:hypothetical protein